MTWHVTVVPSRDLLSSLGALRRTGATITNCKPCPEGYRVVYVTVGSRSDIDA